METKQVSCTFQIDNDLKVFLKIRAATTTETMSQQVNSLLREWKNKQEKENAETE